MTEAASLTALDYDGSLANPIMQPADKKERMVGTANNSGWANYR